jgi:type II secretory pathway component PulF
MTDQPHQPDAAPPTPRRDEAVPTQAPRASEPVAAMTAAAMPGGATRGVTIEYAQPHRAAVRWPHDEPAGMSWPLLIFAWVIGGAGAVVGIAAVIYCLTGFPVAIGVPIALLGLVSLAAVLRSVRRGHATAVLGYLEQAVRLNLPLPDLLAAAALSERGALRRRLMALRERIESGEPIGDALARSLSGLPHRTITLVQAAERNGQIATGLRRIIDQERSARRADSAVRTDPSSALFFRWYPLVLATGVSLVCFLFGLIVVPKYKQICQDFGVPIPPLTRWVWDLTPWLLVVVVAACAVILLARVAGLSGELFTPRLVRLNPLTWAADPLLWHLPPARGIVRSRGLADVCHTAADALEGGHTFERALGEASTLRVNTVLRRRLRVWADLAGQGDPPADAARLAGMPPLVTGMLSTARSGEGAAHAMRFLARYYEGRFSRAAHVLRAAAAPALALFFGVIVAAVAAAQFLPLVRLMDKLTPGAGAPGL